MRRSLAAFALLLAALAPVRAAGLLIPEEKTLPPLAMLNHKVTIVIDDQVAQTKVEQTFRNHTDRELEATYIFPVPKGASVDKFTMWVDGKEVKGEMVEANKAREIYTSIVRRTQDPGLLEYMGQNLLRLRVFPIPRRGDQKVSLRYTHVAPREGKLIEFAYPLKTDGKAIETLEKFSVEATIKSQHAVMNVYSPSHALNLKRKDEKEVTVSFDKEQGVLDRNFQLYYSTGKDDIGITALTHRPVAADRGYFTLLIQPRLGLGDRYRVPQDVVLVMDTSGSMRGIKIEQAQKALKYCLSQLRENDRFSLISFATTVNPYEERLVDATSDQVRKATRWVDELEATGGTAINPALEAALNLRPKDGERPFTVIFFTDGMPTIGETDVEKIFKNISAKNTSNTRIFTFGVGDEVNAAFLDRVADSTRALSAYVRTHENIEHKVSTLYSKMANPILTNLKLNTTGDVRFSDVYSPELPDLFHNEQLVVMGRYAGKGPSAIKLTGKVGKDEKEFVYEMSFPDKTDDGREFVEGLWARRKVGYLLDQVRLNGEKKELVDEIVSLAKRYGITTPYTSYLIVPDGVVVPPTKKAGESGKLAARVTPTVLAPTYAAGFNGKGLGGVGGGTAPLPGGVGGPADPKLITTSPMPAPPTPVIDFARQDGDRRQLRGEVARKELEAEMKSLAKGAADDKSAGKGKSKETSSTYANLKDAAEKQDAYERARGVLATRDRSGVQQGKLGVDFAVQLNNMRYQTNMERTAVQTVNGRRCMEVGGVWIDDDFRKDTKAVVVKAQSEAYFRILEKHPEVKSVYQLGNHVVWLAPSGTALVVDESNGKEKLADEEIAALFRVAAKK